jgi:Dolichyl-phosphate-mannose-protein mannosyltransferase
MQQEKITFRSLIWFLIPAAFLLTYLIIRAQTISLNWDEAYSFFEFVRTPRWFPVELNTMSANNHFLNSWLMKMSVAFLGESELALRLPNLLASLLYFYTAMRIAQLLFTKRIWQVGVFLIITVNPYLLDYFSMARGYGISMAFLLAAVYQFLLFFRNNYSIVQAYRVQLFLLLALLANLTMIHVLLSASLLMAYLIWKNKKQEMTQTDWIHFSLMPLIATLVLAPYFWFMNKAGAFFLGSEISSPIQALYSLGEVCGYYLKKPALIWTILISSIPVFSFLRIKNKQEHFFLLLLFYLVLLGPLAQHYLLGSNFLVGRSALLYVPLLLVLFASSCSLSGMVGKAALVLGATTLIFFTAITYNFRTACDFKEQADVKAMVQFLKKQNAAIPEPFYSNVLTTDLPYEYPVNYYRARFDLKNFGHADRRKRVQGCSWYYGLKTEIPQGDFQIMQEFPETKTVLCKPIDLPKRKVLLETWKDFEHDDPYEQLMKGPFFIGEQGTYAGGKHIFSVPSVIRITDTLKGKIESLSISARFFYFNRNNAALLACHVYAPSGDQYYTMHLTELALPEDEWSITGWTFPVSADATEIWVFLANPTGTPAYLDNLALRLIGTD